MRRVLLKLSGEACAKALSDLPNYADLKYLEEDPYRSKVSGFGLMADAMLLKLVLDIKSAQQAGNQIAIVIGGGNICRGSQGKVPACYRTETDKIGMLATIINGLILNVALNTVGVQSVVLSTRSMPAICELYTPGNASQYLDAGKIVICAGGSGQPFFTTDTAAVVRAGELECNALLKATKVPGIFSSDPETTPDAQFLPFLTYADCLNRNIKVMDFTAVSIAKDQQLAIEVFCVYEDKAITKALNGSIEKSVITS